MDVYRLESSEALKSGAALWVVPDALVSRWTKKLDWYLNFQIFRARRRPPIKTQDSVKSLVKDLDVLDVNVEGPMKMSGQTPLLIAAQNQLPTEALVVVPWTKKTETWLAQVVKTAESLNLHPVRLFLPDTMDAEARKETWKFLGSSKQPFELVEG